MFQVIAKAKGLPWQEVRRLGELQVKLNATLEDMVRVVGEVLHKEPYSKEEVCQLLEVSSEELATTSLSQNTLDGAMLFTYIFIFQCFKKQFQFTWTC
jgi:N-acetylgalactosamine kinase